MSNRNVYGNCWREHGTPFWCAFIRSGLRRVWPGLVGDSEDCCWTNCVMDDFGNLVAVEGWR